MWRQFVLRLESLRSPGCCRPGNPSGMRQPRRRPRRRPPVQLRDVRAASSVGSHRRVRRHKSAGQGSSASHASRVCRRRMAVCRHPAGRPSLGGRLCWVECHPVDWQLRLWAAAYQFLRPDERPASASFHMPAWTQADCFRRRRQVRELMKMEDLSAATSRECARRHTHLRDNCRLLHHDSHHRHSGSPRRRRCACRHRPASRHLRQSLRVRRRPRPDRRGPRYHPTSKDRPSPGQLR
jgi:hypothetical protein